MPTFCLERLVFQGVDKCPQYLWKQYVLGSDLQILRKIISVQKDPARWRITEMASDCSSLLAPAKTDKHAHFRYGEG